MRNRAVVPRGSVAIKGRGDMETFWLLPPEEEGGYPELAPTGKHAQGSSNASTRSPHAWSSFTLGGATKGSSGPNSPVPLSSSPLQFTHGPPLSDATMPSAGHRSESSGVVTDYSLYTRAGARSAPYPNIGTAAGAGPGSGSTSSRKHAASLPGN